jgi:hypothetical protein
VNRENEILARRNGEKRLEKRGIMILAVDFFTLSHLPSPFLLKGFCAA